MINKINKIVMDNKIYNSKTCNDCLFIIIIGKDFDKIMKK